MSRPAAVLWRLWHDAMCGQDEDALFGVMQYNHQYVLGQEGKGKFASYLGKEH